MEQRLYWLHRPERIDEEAGELLPEENLGPISESSVLKIFRRKDHDGFTGDCFYRRDGTSEWRQIRSFCHVEFGDPDLIPKLQRAGITHVRWLATCLPNECRACRERNEELFSIAELPDLPPLDCKCELWCGCILGAARDE